MQSFIYFFYFPLAVVTCEVPPLTAELDVSGCTPNDSVDYSTVCQYSCAVGYDIIGDANTTCTADGTFSPRAPTCQSINQEIKGGGQLATPFPPSPPKKKLKMKEELTFFS